jgi:predicted nucleic-acid-binding Zn-ribbon protein
VITPTCPKCGNSFFEMKEINVEKAKYRHNAIICKNCGAILSIEQWTSEIYMLGKIAEKLGVRLDS